MKAMGLTGSPVSQTSCAQCHFTDKTSDSINQFTNKNLDRFLESLVNPVMARHLTG